VVIPCFNHGQFVADAVRSALAQTDADTRVVVVNDGSTDETTATQCNACALLTPDARDRVTVVHQENRGLPAARNAGARVATEAGWSEYLVFLDADDFIEPTFVSRLAAEVDANQDGPRTVSHAYCQERLVDKAFGTWTVPEWDPVLLLITNLHPVTALVRRECFEAAGGFDETMRQGYEDWEFWIRLSGKGWRGVRVREPLFNWRRHADVTMVIEAVSRHEQLLGSITHKHADLYTKHAMELVKRSNVLLRKADANWIDENHEAIVVRDLRAANIQLWQDICKARQQAAALEQKLKRAETLAAQIRDGYEAKPAVKVSKKLHRWLDSLPGPLGRAVKGTMKRTVGGE
jgi:glycosyltransferase involved in cell wall biosynthesis